MLVFCCSLLASSTKLWRSALPLSSSSEDIEAFRARLTQQLAGDSDETLPRDALEAGSQASQAIRAARDDGKRRVLVDVLALDDAPSFLQELESLGIVASDAISEYPNLADIDSASVADIVLYAPENMAQTRRLVRSAQFATIVNHKFAGVLPIEFDDADYAYMLRPYKRVGGLEAVQVCLFRKYPRPYALFVKYAQDASYRRATTFTEARYQNEPPSNEQILAAIETALNQANRGEN